MEIHPERVIDQQHVEPDKPEYRPGADQDERHAGDQADGSENRHEQQEPARAHARMGLQNRIEPDGLGVRIVAAAGQGLGHRPADDQILRRLNFFLNTH